MFVVRGILNLPSGQVVHPGVYRGFLNDEYDATGAQISRRYFIVLLADQPDEEAIDITDLYEEKADP